MIKVLWINFSGGPGSDYRVFGGQSWSSNLSVYTGDLKDKKIGLSHATCDCGNCRSCKVKVANISDYANNIDKIRLNDKCIKFSDYQDDFYKTFVATVYEIFPDTYYSDGRNLAVNTHDKKFDMKEICDLFFEKLTAQHYSFEKGELKRRKGNHFPLQLDGEERKKFVAWLAKDDDKPVHHAATRAAVRR